LNVKAKIETADAWKKGLVYSTVAGFYYVQDENGQTVVCRRRGKLKAVVVTGDQAWFTPLDAGRGIIEALLPRQNELERPRIANISLAIIVMAMNQPKPDLLLLDKLLWLVQQKHIRPCILLTKSDLVPAAQVRTIRDYYGRLFDVLEFSQAKPAGLEAVRRRIQGEIAVLAGPSGVGKTSLLNCLREERPLPTQAVSQRLQRGKHTTRHVELYALGVSGWIADTPGFNVLELPAMDRLEVSKYFPDFTPYTGQCRFHNCLHDKEKDCAVIKAAEAGWVLRERHEHYRAILHEILAKEMVY
jgi:ribosome biogenesis GTPase